ncbi:hypothetical protein D3C81_1555310 [compost metagenome]
MLALVGQQRRGDLARAHHRDVDAARLLLQAQDLGEADHAELGGAVGGLGVAAHDPGQRRHQHQMAALRHVPEHPGGEVAAADQVDAHHQLEGLRRQLGEQRRAQDAGGVEGEVRSAQLRHRRVHRFGHRPGVAYVDGEGLDLLFGPSAQGAQFIEDAGLDLEVEQRHAGPLAHQRLGDLAADTAAAAGNECDARGAINPVAHA